MAYVRVGGVDIPVVYCELPDFGQYLSAPESEIRIDKDLKESLKVMTLIHEIIHAVSEHYAVDLSERDTRILETAVVQILRDNSGMVKDMVRVLGE